MAYSVKNKKGKEYFLHSREVTLRGDRKQTIYFFAQEIKPGALDKLPDGYVVQETEQTGLPVLKKA